MPHNNKSSTLSQGHPRSKGIQLFTTGSTSNKT